MKPNLNTKLFFSIFSILFFIVNFSIFPQQRQGKTEVKNESRQPAANNSTPAIKQERPVSNQPSTPPQRALEPPKVQRPVVNNPAPRVEQQKQIINEPPPQPRKIVESPQVQRPVVNNPAPQYEQRTQVIDEPPQRIYEPQNIERPTKTNLDPPIVQRERKIDEPTLRRPVLKPPIRAERNPRPPKIHHNPSYYDDQIEVCYTVPIYIPDFPTIYCPGLEIIVDNPIVDPIDIPEDLPLSVKSLTLKEQAIQDYYDEYYFDAIIDLNAAIQNDPLDLELFFWRGMTWYKLENYDSSVVDFSRYLKLYDDDAEAYYYRGLSNLNLVNKLEAYHDFIKANELGYKKAEDILEKDFKDYHI